MSWWKSDMGFLRFFMVRTWVEQKQTPASSSATTTKGRGGKVFENKISTPLSNGNNEIIGAIIIRKPKVIRTTTVTKSSLQAGPSPPSGLRTMAQGPPLPEEQQLVKSSDSKSFSQGCVRWGGREPWPNLDQATTSWQQHQYVFQVETRLFEGGQREIVHCLHPLCPSKLLRWCPDTETRVQMMWQKVAGEKWISARLIPNTAGPGLFARNFARIESFWSLRMYWITKTSWQCSHVKYGSSFFSRTPLHFQVLQGITSLARYSRINEQCAHLVIGGGCNYRVNTLTRR